MTEPNGKALQLPLELVPEDELVPALGAILLVAGEPVPVAVLAQHLGCKPGRARAALRELDARLAAAGLLLQWCADDRVQIATAPRFAPLLQRFLGLERTVRLSQAALETLAIVAYHQPVTRAELDTIRGVDSSGVLQTLLARGLVEASGRLPTVGNPIQYTTTPEFLRFFGLSSLDELPPPSPGDGTAGEKAATGDGGHPRQSGSSDPLSGA